MTYTPLIKIMLGDMHVCLVIVVISEQLWGSCNTSVRHKHMHAVVYAEGRFLL